MDSAQQIIADACSIAKTRQMLALAGRFFTSTMNDLCYHRKLKENMATTQITFAAGSNGPFPLPDDYQRPYNLYYTVNGYPYQMSQISLKQYDALFKDQSVANYPRLFCTETDGQVDTPATPARLFVYPQSTSIIAATLRYFILRPDIAAPEASSQVPWFIDQEYLRNDVARQLMTVTDDTRLETFVNLCDKQLKKHLVIDNDESNLPNNVQLDPAKFFTTRSLPPTKATGW